MLLDQCRYLDQPDLMLRASLFQCRPVEAEIQRRYIERKQYDFVVYDRNESDVIYFTRESDVWSNLEPGTRVVMGVVTEEVIWCVTAAYWCPCGTSNSIRAALQCGCTIICRRCERRFQVTRTQRRQNTNSQKGDGIILTPAAGYLIRNFLAILAPQILPFVRVLVHAAIRSD
ncbi:hypothetical protein OG21DRAFT_270225 [Imleria badia]|nr:hypothetical protein OG21DRAFT_270225 [Imleria badia]